MNGKPSYKELEQRVRELENAESDRKKLENELIHCQESLRLFKDIISSAAEPMAVINSHYEFQFVNNAYEEFWGISRKDIIGKSVPDIMGIDRFEEIVKIKVDQCLSGETVRYSASFQSPVKGQRYMQLNYYPYKSEDGEIVGLINISYDVSQYIEAKNMIQKKEEMLSKTESIAHIGSWEWEIAKDEVIWSHELYNIFQLDPDGAAPNWAEHPKLYHPEDFEKLREAAETAIADGKPYELELRAFRKDGETRVCTAKGFPATDENGQVVRLFGLLQDITDLKQAEEALRKSEERFSLAMEASKDGIWDWNLA